MRDLSYKFYSGVKIIRLSIRSLQNVRLAGCFKLMHVLSYSFLLFTLINSGHSSGLNRESLKNLENNLLKKEKKKKQKAQKTKVFLFPPIESAKQDPKRSFKVY